MVYTFVIALAHPPPVVTSTTAALAMQALI